MDEKFLYHIWDAGHLLTPLKTVSGKTLQVKYQGQYNTARGPDFHNVIIELNGEILRGDVEIHLHSYDWIAHNHHEDPHYNQVILHIVMDAGQQQYTIKEDGKTIEILELKNQLSDEIRKLLEKRETSSLNDNITYCDLLSAIDNDALISILTSWGLQRFQNKVRRFDAALMLSDFDQVLYEGIMEAMGYEKNKHNLLILSQTIPLKNIREWQADGMTALELASIYCCSSKLLSLCKHHLKPELYQLLLETYERQRFYARSWDIDWQLFRIRPNSHPLYRLLTMANLLNKTQDQGLLNYFLERVDIERSDSKKAFSEFSHIFKESILPGAETLPRPGKSLISNIYINIFLPISYMFFEKHSESDNCRKILKYYKEFPALEENHILRYMSRYMSDAHYDLINHKTILQQGLLELFHRFCNYHLCSECLASKS
ncbi:MAG TPA: DUF2851 family protein [Candidatus Syntrophosphaera thermopropionivorans]|nr:DUF2851 family protein [Candidatus Syntrophosphaera thermopropionivorans]